jgi:hypothetical protein
MGESQMWAAVDRSIDCGAYVLELSRSLVLVGLWGWCGVIARVGQGLREVALQLFSRGLCFSEAVGELVAFELQLISLLLQCLLLVSAVLQSPMKLRVLVEGHGEKLAGGRIASWRRYPPRCGEPYSSLRP